MDLLQSQINYLKRRSDFYIKEKIKTEDPVIRSYFVGKEEAIKEAIRVLTGEF